MLGLLFGNEEFENGVCCVQICQEQGAHGCQREQAHYPTLQQVSRRIDPLEWSARRHLLDTFSSLYYALICEFADISRSPAPVLQFILDMGRP